MRMNQNFKTQSPILGTKFATNLSCGIKKTRIWCPAACARAE